jgi:hypothetical protein
LKRSGNSDFGDAMRRPIEQRVALEHDIAAVRGIESAQTVEQSGLACAVRADQAQDLALLEVE